MFTAIKTAFSGVFVKVLCAALLGVGGLALWQYMKANSLEKDNITITNNYNTVKGKYDTLKGDYANLEDQLNKKNASGKVDEEVQTGVNTTTTVYRDRFDLVDKKVEQKVASIRAEYAAKEQTDANIKARDRAISTERINGLWGSFCTNQPKHPTCASAAASAPAQ